jgi:myo-inositol-1(or 4)-monophosphatase
MIEEAIYFATTAHAGQKRKGTDIPYILHPLEAGAIATKFEFNEAVICAAILHDVVEDTDVPLSAIRKRFGERVAFLVSAESEDKRNSWKERKENTLTVLRETTDEGVKIVALCDKLSNIRAIYNDYKALGEALWQKFNVKDREQQKWYYTELVKSLSSLSRYAVYDEFSCTVTKVFGI